MTTNRAVTNSTGSADPAAMGQEPPSQLGAGAGAPQALPSAHLPLPPCGRHPPTDTHPAKSPSTPGTLSSSSSCPSAMSGGCAGRDGCCPPRMLPTADAACRGFCPLWCWAPGFLSSCGGGKALRDPSLSQEDFSCLTQHGEQTEM